ncbi:MAG: sodium-independent anion transporter [Phycisphaerales bacterium]
MEQAAPRRRCQVQRARIKIYQLHGPLFFGSVTRFRDLFDPNNDPDDVVIDFYFSRVYDQSGLEAINTLAARYQKSANSSSRHLSEDIADSSDRTTAIARRSQHLRRPALPCGDRPPQMASLRTIHATPANARHV